MVLFEALPALLLVFVVLPLIISIGLKAGLRSFAAQAFWITLENLQGPPKGFPRVGVHAESDVTDPKWLTDVLEVKYPKTVVSSATAKSMGSDMGNASTMFRLEIEYKKNPHNLPSVMIAKLIKPGLMSRLPFTATRMNEMETLFYSTSLCDEMIDKHKLNFARGYGGRYRQRGGNCFVLMEDVINSPQMARFTTEQSPVNNMDQGKAIVKTLGQYHGSFFNATDRFDKDLSWIIKHNDPILSLTREAFERGWDLFIKRLGHRVPEEVKERGKLLIPVSQAVSDYMALPPLAIVHGDCHLENSYFRGDNNELGLYDMQLMRVGKGAIDLASYIGGSFTSDLLGGGVSNDEGEDELLRVYLESLRERAGSLKYVNEFGKEVEYDFETLKRDYRIGLCLLFIWNVAAVLAVPFDTEAHLDYDEYITRLVASVHRTSAINYALWYISVPGVADKLNLRGGVPPLGPLGTPPIQRVIPGHPTNIENNVRVHQAVVSPEDPVDWVDKYIKRPLKYKFIHRMTSGRGGHHGQKTSEMSDEFLEGHHSVTFAEGTEMEKHAFDSYYVSAFAADGTSFALRWCRRFDEESGEVWLAIKVPSEDNGLYLWSDHPITTCTCVEDGVDTVVVRNRDSEMRLTCLVPMKRWRVEFNGKLKHKESGRLVPASFDLETDSCMPHFAFGSHVSPELTAQALSIESFSKEFFEELKATHQEHYEQFARVTGTLSLSGRSIPIKAKGMRDRAFGAREWGYMQRYFASYFWAGDIEDGPVFSIACASLPTLSAGKFGFVGVNGEMPIPMDAISGKIAEIANDGIPPQEFELAFRCNGTHYLLRVFAPREDSIGLNMQNAMWVNLRLARFDISYVDPETFELKEMRGYGGSEFGYRFEGYQPVRPKKAVVAPIHVGAE